MAQSIFRPSSTIEVEIKNFNDGYVDSVDPTLAPDNSLVAGSQNVEIPSVGTVESRDGITLYGNFLGPTTGILGGFNVVNAAGTQEQLNVWNTGVYRYVNGIWTLLTGGTTLTTNLKADGAYYPLTNKFYIVNGTDHAQVYTSGSTIAEDTSFKKGKYITHHQNRLLVANVSSQEDYVWYTDLGVDTFGANNYFRVEGNITGIITYYDKVLVFTKRKIFRLQNFTFSGAIAGPESVIELPQDFGAIYDRTICVVNGFVYFMGQDVNNKAALYKCDGYKATNVSENKISNLMRGLSTSQLENACAVPDGIYFHVETAESGEVSNNLGIFYDTVRDIFLPPVRRFLTNRVDFSCMWASEVSGEWQIYAGTQGTGQVYKLHSASYYDEIPEERYLTLGTYNVAVDANPARRGAQSFKMSNYNTSQSVDITKVALYLKKVSGTTTDLQLRIETDNNGKPSGTAVDNATATVTAFSDTSYIWKTISFSTPPTLTGNTTYWLVLQHVTEATGDSKYAWLGDACTPTYTYGNLATYSIVLASLSNTYNPSANAVYGYVGPGFYAADTTLYSFTDLRAATAGTGKSTYNQETVSIIESASGTAPTPWKSMMRSYVLFDTSSLPADAVITSASVQLRCFTKEDAYSQSVGITAGTPAADTDIALADYDVGNFGSTRFATDIPISSLAVNDYNTWTLNASGISAIVPAGITKFALRLSCDIDNTTPTPYLDGSSHRSSVGFSGGGANYDRGGRLVINYSTATGEFTWTSDTLTDQAFSIYAESPIEATAKTKLFSPNGLGKEYKLHKFMSQFNTTGDYGVLVGFNTGSYNSATNYVVNLSGESGNTWGGGGTWGSGLVWGGDQARNFVWTTVYGFAGRLLQMVISNNAANQPWKFDGALVAITRRNRQA